MEKLHTPKEIAEYFSVKLATVQDWLRKGQLTGIKVGRVWRIKESDLQKFVDEMPNEN